MNSELTINDLKETITDNINNCIRSLNDEVDEFKNINNPNDLEVWYDNIEFTIKSLKKLKLLKNKIDKKNSLTNDEINDYHTLALKPERIDTDDENELEYEERLLIKKRPKYFNPVTEKFVYSDSESDCESDSEYECGCEND